MAKAAKGLKSLDLPILIETSDVDFSKDFYNPALSNANEYKRGVGYFTSSWFKFASAGLKGLAENGGVAKWIISPKLSERDWEALQKGDKAKQNSELYEELKRSLADLEEGLEEDTLNTIAWMIADGLLLIKIAIPAGTLSGNFHDKWGIVTDEYGNKIGFHGSQNDSQQGFANYESYSVFLGWESERDLQRIEAHEARFDEMWNDKKSGIKTYSLPDSISLELAELRDETNRPYDDPPPEHKFNSSYRWRHQEEAVEAVIGEGSGILDMATGTGKTRTSLKILARLLREDRVGNIVVSTYGNDLLNQWYETLVKHFDPGDIRIFRHFGGTKEMGSFLTKEREQLEALIVSYDNLSECIESDSLGKLQNTLLICDEVHNIGSKTRREDLSGELDVFPHRLGLSATPLDGYDETRNQFILEEVGPIVYEFGLEDAIKRGILCELEYTPLYYELSDEDKEKQQEAFGTYQGMKKQDPTVPKSRLYMMLARVRKESEEKLPVFEELLENHSDILDDCLIFVETMDYGKFVQDIIHEYTKSYRTYYGVDDEDNLEQFSRGQISTLVTSKAISEGIDIKSVRNIILFTSDRSKGTTIQRIGRALRVDPENFDKIANIVDFVVRSDVHSSLENDETEPPDRERYMWLKDLETVQAGEE